MTIRIGANPIAWSNDDLQEIGGTTPLEVCLAQAKEAGFEGMELGHKFPREAVALKAVLQPFGLSCIGGWHSIELLNRSAKQEFEAARSHRQLLKAMHTPIFIVAETSNAIHGNRSIPLSRRPKISGRQWLTYGKELTGLADMLADEGFSLCYHHHMGTIVESRADIDALMENTGNAVHLLFDTGHAYWGGSDPGDLARTYKARIGHVHTKDVRKAIMEKSKARDWSFLDSILGEGDELGVYTVPGDGVIDYVTALRQLNGYSGWIVVEAEQDPKKANALVYAKKGIANLKRYIQEAGLR
jgi:inosose dehydratase